MTSLLAGCPDATVVVADLGVVLTDLGPGRDAAGMPGDPCVESTDCQWGGCAYPPGEPPRCFVGVECDHERNLGCPPMTVCHPECGWGTFTCSELNLMFAGACLRACGADSPCPRDEVCRDSPWYPDRSYCSRP